MLKIISEIYNVRGNGKTVINCTTSTRRHFDFIATGQKMYMFMNFNRNLSILNMILIYLSKFLKIYCRFSTCTCDLPEIMFKYLMSPTYFQKVQTLLIGASFCYLIHNTNRGFRDTKSQRQTNYIFSFVRTYIQN